MVAIWNAIDQDIESFFSWPGTSISENQILMISSGVNAADQPSSR